MACEDRQLTEAQRQAGYQQGRTGVVRAVRPFSGRPTLENLLDYINRELYPAVKSTRDRLNDVYLPSVDNAPSANPLVYYFSSETAAADPTAGRIRLDASPQDTATVIRVSETNARLVDSRPWLEVMAGGATTPLGVVTLSDAINPGRAIRFDLDSMTDQGTYWDLAVTPIESTHDDPFVDGGALVVSFIPGVASDGVTVPPGSLTPIAAQSVLGNPTDSAAAPVAIQLSALSVLGRQGTITGTGNVEGIDVPPSTTLSGENLVLKSNAARTTVRFTNFTLTDMPQASDNRFLGNISGATARPTYTDFGLLSSTSVSYENVGKTFIREALFGDVVALQNNNETVIQTNVVTDAKLRDSGPLSVIGRAANSTGDPADISATAASDAVLRESGSTIGWGTIATGGLANNSVTNAKLAQMAAGTQKGRQIDAGTGDPVDLTGAEQGENIRFATQVSTAAVSGTVDLAINADTTYVVLNGSGDVTLRSVTTKTEGAIVCIEFLAAGSRLTINHLDAGATLQQLATPSSVNLTLLGTRTTFWLIQRNSTWRVMLPGQFTSIAAGIVPASGGGSSNVLLANATWGTVPTAGIADDAVTNAKLANMAAGTVKGRQPDAGTGDPVDLTGAEVGEIIRFPNRVIESVGGTLDNYVLDPLADTLSITANATLSGIAHSGTGKRIIVANGGGLGSGIVVELLHFTISTGGNRFVLPKGTTLRLYPGDGVELQHDVTGNFWFTTAGVKPYYRTNSSGLGASRGRINFVNGTSVGWTNADVAADDEVTITPNVIANSISNTLLRDSGALSVIGRSANSSGDPADISATAASGAVLRESGSGIGFGTVATAGIADDAVTNAKLRNSAAVSVIGRSANSTGDPADIAAAANDRLLARTSDSLAFQQLTDGMVPTNTIALTKLANILDNRFLGNITGATGAVTATDFASLNSTSIIYENTGKTFIRQALSGDVVALQNNNTTTIQPNVVSDAKLRQSVALSVIGRSANSTGNVADIAAANDGEVLRRSGTTLGFGTVATAGITDDAVSNAKLANMAQSTIKGRAEGAGTGDPTDLTPAQVIAVIDGENATWTGTHAFNGTTLSATTSSNITLSSGATLTLSASTVVQATSPTRLASTLAFDSVLSSSEGSSVDNKGIGSINVWRLNPTISPLLLNGMTATLDGQLVLITNTSTTNNIQVTDEGSTTAAARFALGTTSITIEPLRGYVFWYDGADDRWKGIGNYPT